MTEGQKLLWKRKMLGLTAEQLGNLCCVTKQTIRNTENKDEITPISKLMNYELAKIFIEWDPEKAFVAYTNKEEA